MQAKEQDPSPSSSVLEWPSDKASKAVVIGSGFGGLAAALRLLARGYQVKVIEKLDQPGGRAYVYRDKGFVFDAGPTVVTAPFLFEELWGLFGQNMSDHVELRPVTPFYRIRFDDGDVFDYTGDAEAMRQEVARISPDDVKGYERFVKESERIFDVGFEQLSFEPFNGLADMIKIIPDMVKLQSYRSVHGLASKYIKSDKLRQVFSFHPLLVGGNPFATTSIYALILYLERKWGVHFAMGGTGQLVGGLVDLMQKQGGLLHLNTEVDEIVCENGRATGVRLADGQVLQADVLVSNADSAFTYGRLLRNFPRKRWTDKKLDRSKYSMSLFVWYFGTDKKFDDVAHHSILLGPRYKGLLSDIFDRKVLAEDFSLYLHRPTATDPSMAPEGCDAFYVLSPVPHLEADVDWAVETEIYRKKVEKYLEDTVMPELGKHVVSSHCLTPIDFQNRLNSMKGAAFGLEPVLTQSASFRPHNRSEELKNLFLVGAGTHPGAGMPGVLSSAKVLEKVLPDAEEKFVPRANKGDVAA